jgi:hypothetical protein
VRQLVSFRVFLLGFVFATLAAVPWLLAWNNGGATNQEEECSNPPYATHDWIAEHALMLLPEDERAWLMPHKVLYLLGTEAPDNKTIPIECGGPHRGYDDRLSGHSVEWKADFLDFVEKKNRAARRAQAEYDKAAKAFKEGNAAHAAFYLGAMAHYIGDVSQYGHSVPFETKKHHKGYEDWVESKTKAFNGGTFESFIEADGFEPRKAFTAVKRVSKATADGQGKILHAGAMEQRFDTKGQEYVDSVGHSLNLGVNELADVLHAFFLNVVSGQQ